MLTNLIIPVIDTESKQFEFNGNLSREDFEDMVLDKFNKTDRQINAFMHRNRSREFVSDLSDYDQGGYYEEEPDNEVEVEALLLDSKRRDFKEDNFFDYIERSENENSTDIEKMFLLLVNVNPDGLDEDAETELKFWLDDSARVWNDEDLDRKTKLDVSPTRDLKIVLSDGNKYTMKNCKVFENYSDDRYPLYFAMIVEKIIL